MRLYDNCEDGNVIYHLVLLVVMRSMGVHSFLSKCLTIPFMSGRPVLLENRVLSALGDMPFIRRLPFDNPYDEKTQRIEQVLVVTETAGRKPSHLPQ